ncbi:hypothetical protein [Parathermosynechococcus lividus]
MPLPPLALPPTPAVRIAGDVVVHPQAILAPGVLLWAEAGAIIRIAAGVCIGMGSVIHAHGGAITVSEGVNIGAGVLLIGQVTIEPHACIGTSATLMNTIVPAGAVVAAGSLLGDNSRRWQPKPAPETSDPWQEAASPASPAPDAPHSPDSPPTDTEPAPVAAVENATPTAKPTVVYGQAYVSQMFAKMFRTEPLTNEQP